MKDNGLKKIGVWLDHSKAMFIALDTKPTIIETIYSNSEEQLRISGNSVDGIKLGNYRSTNNEHHKHNREQGLINEYYDKLQSKLKAYNEIFLFGPTTAKDELKNILKADKHFNEKVIKIEASDYITENQMKAMAKDFINV